MISRKIKLIEHLTIKHYKKDLPLKFMKLQQTLKDQEFLHWKKNVAYYLAPFYYLLNYTRYNHYEREQLGCRKVKKLL